jgi:hypothetical protein
LDSNGCWIWQGALGKEGYGRVGRIKKTWLAHRLSYIETYGPFDPKLQVLHSCDVRACINPSHLFLCTQQDNVDDMIDKVRDIFPSSGEGNGHSLLSDDEFEDVMGWIDLGVSYRWISKEYGISYRTVQSYSQFRARSSNSGIVSGGKLKAKEGFGL